MPSSHPHEAFAVYRHEEVRIRKLLVFTALLAALNGVAGSADARSSSPVTVQQALQICVQARHRAGPLPMIVASPHISVRGYFVRVVGNGYVVIGESGKLYEGSVRITRMTSRIPPAGGLNVGIPAKQIPHGIPTGTWVQLSGTLRCYTRAGEILVASSWNRSHSDHSA